jgi:dihydroxy-acid dehydratase
VNLEVGDEELAQRRAAWLAPEPLFHRGWLQIYRDNVGPLPEGAVLVKYKE